jgi:hypothetical protein
MACPVLEARLRISDFAALRTIIGEAADDDPDLKRSYVLDAAELDAVAALSDPPFRPDRRLTTLMPWHALRKVPYLIHTGYELPLMLEGRKPLAAFRDSARWLECELRIYDSFVRQGRFATRVIAQGDMREVYFALPGQEWRIDTYIQLWNAADGNWDDNHERRQGELLGYEDWQNEWWIANRKSLLSDAGRDAREDD